MATARRPSMSLRCPRSIRPPVLRSLHGIGKHKVRPSSASMRRGRGILIFKIVQAADWATAEQAGAFDGSAHDKADGFLHFSTGPQLPETLRLYYAGQDNLMLVAVAADALSAALKWEHAPSRGEDFPHLFAALP